MRWYLRYPLSYEHVAELVAERGVDVDASCIWRWVQADAPELNQRCRPYLKPTNKSDRIDETYINVKGEDKYLYRYRRRTLPAQGDFATKPYKIPEKFHHLFWET